MTQDPWPAIQEWFHQALEHPAPRRYAFLSQACPDAHIRAEVISLLAAHEGAGPIGRLDEPATVVTPPLEWIGPYRLVRRIGEGGMGVVYLAERSGEGFSQVVALKLIRAGYADPRLRDRLAEERRLLARLEHPGIAGVDEASVSHLENDNPRTRTTIAATIQRRPIIPRKNFPAGH